MVRKNIIDECNDNLNGRRKIISYNIGIKSNSIRVVQGGSYIMVKPKIKSSIHTLLKHLNIENKLSQI